MAFGLHPNAEIGFRTVRKLCYYFNSICSMRSTKQVAKVRLCVLYFNVYLARYFVPLCSKTFERDIYIYIYIFQSIQSLYFGAERYVLVEYLVHIFMLFVGP